MSYNEAKNLAVFDRRDLLNSLIEENTKRQEEIDEARNSGKDGSPKTMGGDELKNYLSVNGNPT